MKATFEISLYPLSENYERVVLEFIDDLKKHDELQVETNGLSTQLFGEKESMFSIIDSLTTKYFEKYNAILVMKIGKGHLRFES